MDASCFDAAPEFIERDHRQNRTGYPISKEQMHAKHAVMFPPEMVRGKTVLDLGCCLGATGHWVLSTGATRYLGVELQKEYADTARELLGKYHGSKAAVVESAIEPWFDANREQFDIVVMLGVLYVFVDYYPILRHLAAAAKERVVIESVYHDRAVLGVDFCGVEFVGNQQINVATENASLLGRGSRISPRGLEFLMQGFGFASEGVLAIPPITESRDVYNVPITPGGRGRFCMRFTRSGEKSVALTDDLQGEKTGGRHAWNPQVRV